MKILIIGSGWFARKHASILAGIPDVSVAGFCSRSLDHARAAADRLNAEGGSVGAFASVSEALDVTKPDAAIVAVTPDGHGPIELELISRGIPFLVEKPIGMEPDTPRRIAEAVDRAGLVTSVGFHVRYLDTTTSLHSMLRATTPVIANGYWMGTLPGVSWWRHVAESGGQFVEQAVHIIDLVRLLFGEADAVFATTTQRAITELHSDADVPDAGAAIVRMKSGLTVTLATSCMGPVGLRVGLEVVAPEAIYQYGLGSLTVKRQNETIETRPAVDPYLVEDTAFVEAVRTGNTDSIRSPYADALHTHALSMAIMDSARRGAEVRL